VALPSDRNSLIKFCLQELGAPVIQINIDEEQVENQVDKALELFKEYHVDGTSIFYKAFKVTGSILRLEASPGTDFEFHELIQGSVSGAQARVESYDHSTKEITFTFIDKLTPKNFIDGEIISGKTSGATACLVGCNAQTLGMMDKKYIDLPDYVVGIIEMLKPRSTFSSHSVNPFDLQYQIAQQVTIQTFLNADLLTYYMFQQDIQLWNQLFDGVKPYWHSRKQNRLYIHSNWTEEFKIGQYIVLKFWGAVKAEEFPKVYGDKWIRKYLTALLQVQWGRNITKYNNVTLPGGIVLNGEQILESGMKAKEEAELELRSTYEMKTPFKIG
jgi:hypothetical protein